MEAPVTGECFEDAGSKAPHVPDEHGRDAGTPNLMPDVAPDTNCLCARVQHLADHAHGMNDSEVVTSLGVLHDYARAHHFRCSAGSPLTTGVFLCETICGLVLSEAENGLTTKALSAALVFMGELGKQCGIPRRLLQRLFALMEPCLSAPLSMQSELWCAMLDMLRISANIDSEEPESHSRQRSQPHVVLLGGRGLCSCRLDGQARDPCEPREHKVLWNCSNSPDVAEVVRTRIFALKGATFGAWVYFHAFPAASDDRFSRTGTILRYWEPKLGGWSLIATPAEGDVDDVCDVYFVRLRNDQPIICQASKRVRVGQIPLGQWFPLTIEFRYQSGSPASLRLQGDRSPWTQIDLGPQVNRSQFPPPASGGFGGGDDAERDGATSGTACDEATGGASVVFFEEIYADLAALWLFEELCSDKVADCLRSKFDGKLSKVGGLWSTPSRRALDDADDLFLQLENELLTRAVLAYVPGYKRDQDLINYCQVDRKSGNSGSLLPTRASMMAVENLDKALDMEPCSILIQMLSPGWLTSLLWALARLLPNLHHADELASKDAVVSELLNRTFAFVVDTIKCEYLCKMGITKKHVQGGRVFLQDGGFAVWSYVLWRHVSPAWIDTRTIEVICELLDNVASDESLCRECWAHLFGPHMMYFWREIDSTIQFPLWKTLHRQCSFTPSLLDTLGGPDWLLWDAMVTCEGMDVFCIKTLMLLENYAADDLTMLWARLSCLSSASRQLSPPEICALIIMVCCIVLPDAKESAIKRGQSATDRFGFEEAIHAFTELCGHEDESVRAEAILALRHLEQMESPLSSSEISAVCARLTDSAQLACSERSFDVLWAWLKCERVEQAEWLFEAPLMDKLKLVQAHDGSHCSAPVQVDPGANFTSHGCGSGALLCAILSVLDRVGNDSLCLRFLHEYKLLIGCSGEQNSTWWEALKSHSSVWHRWFLRFLARNIKHDANFLVAAKLHTMIVSRALTLDPAAWHVIQDMISWVNAFESGSQESVTAAAVCRALLIQLFEAVRASFEVQLRDAASNVQHPLCENLTHLVHILDAFLMPTVTPTVPASESTAPHSLRLVQGAGVSAPLVWLDYVIVVQLMRLWSAFLLRDPLQNQLVLGFDLGAWINMRWQQRPFPLDGVTEQILLESTVQSESQGTLLFMELLHWGTRCLIYRAPTEADLTSHLEMRLSSHAERKMSRSSSEGSASTSIAAICAAAVPSDIQMVLMQKEILLVLRHLAMCLLAVGSHALHPISQGVRETLGVAVISFCAHAHNCSEQWRKGLRSEARQDAKAMLSEAREHAADVLLLLMLLCCQKWGRPAAGFSEEDLRACSESGEFPFTVLRVLSKLQWDKVATDLRDLLAKQPGPKTWLGTTTPWMDPVRTMEGSLFSFVFSPVNSRLAATRSSGARAQENGAPAPGRRQGGNRREGHACHQLLERWGFQASVSDSPVAQIVWNPLEAQGLLRGTGNNATLSPDDERANPSTQESSSSRAMEPIDEQFASVSIAAVSIATSATPIPEGVRQKPIDRTVLNGEGETLSQFLPPLPVCTPRSTRRVDVHCRRLQRLHRNWTTRAWRSTCRTNKTPGSLWQQCLAWEHPPPPLPPPPKGSDQSETKHHSMESPYVCAGKFFDRTRASLQSDATRKFSQSWRSSFSGSTAAEPRTLAGHTWAIDRLQDSSGRRPLMWQDEERLGSESSASSSSSGLSVSDDTDGSETDGSATFKQDCTWIRREGNYPCSLRLTRHALQLYYFPSCSPSQSSSGTKRASRNMKSAPSSAQRGRSCGAAMRESSPIKSAFTSYSPASYSPGRVRGTPMNSPQKASLTSMPNSSACPSSKQTQKKRRLRHFMLQNLSEDGINPRRFLHRPTALEICFTDRSAPLRLHFDEEAPPPLPVHLPRSVSLPAMDMNSSLDSDVRAMPASRTTVPNDSTFSFGNPIMGLAAGITGGLGHGFGSASAAASAMLGRTTALWIGGSSSPGGRRRVSPDISVRDEVWWRLAEAQRVVQQEAASRGDRSSEGQKSALDSAVFDADTLAKAGIYEPAMSWALHSGCRSLMQERSPSYSSEHEYDDTSAEPLKVADTLKLRRQYQEVAEKGLGRITAEWQRGEISNFGYLQAVNFFSGRSPEDLSQYPVVPWVLRNLRHTDPPSAVLARGDLEECTTYFRDLSRTLGDLGDPERRIQLQQKYLQAADPENLPYHYGTHYSTPAFVMHFLIRAKPFADLARALQGGRFDVPDRIFYSLPETWRSCVSEMSDVRELIPELFCLPECLLNLSELNFGVRQDGTKVDDVELPRWARDVYHFISEHRLALESEPVSRSIHKWIDLVWGPKQVGPAAVEALNVFFPLTYASGIDWATIDPKMRHSKEQQVLHFGQTPLQVFTQAHPPRDAMSWAPSLIRPAKGSIAVRSWHSSFFTSSLRIRHSTLSTHSRSGRQSALHQAAVVAIGAHISPTDVSRLFVIQADGTLWCYRLRHPYISQPTESSGNSAIALLSFQSQQDISDVVSPQVDMEATFSLPDTKGGLREQFLIHHDVAPTASCWAFLPEKRYFVRGGYRDGSIVYGCTADTHTSAIEHAHGATVSAVAASSECARFLAGSMPSSSSQGLLILSGALDGTVNLWAAIDVRWSKYISVVRWHVHLEAVRCVDFDEKTGVALSASDDGFVHVYRLRPAMRPVRTFRFRDGLPVCEARFGSTAPATIVACSQGDGRSVGAICVWAMHGFLLAVLELPSSVFARGLRVLSEGTDAQEALFFGTSDGHVELRSLPYLHPVWRTACHESIWPSATDSSPERKIAWLGHVDGSFEVLCADSAPCKT